MWVYSGFIWLMTGSSDVTHKAGGFVQDLMGYYLTSRNWLCRVITAPRLHIIGQTLTLPCWINVQIQCQSLSQ
jgi:hypothetical protein